MRKLVLIFAFFSFLQNAKANQLTCKDSGKNVTIYVKTATVSDSTIILILNDDSVINSQLSSTDHPGEFSLNEQESQKINLQVTLTSRDNQSMLLVNPLMSMEIPQVLSCD